MLTRLSINHFRNISELSITPNPHFNIIYGPNGAGKTSILEAIYMLGLGRSFRNRSVQRIVKYGELQLTVFGLLENTSGQAIPIGIEKQKNGQSRIRIDQKDILSAAVLAELLPVQIVNPDSYQLLDAGPKFRRQFLDWGLFHVEQRFMEEWQRLRRVLMQRNAALKSRMTRREVQIWDPELIAASEVIETMRREYFQQFKPIFEQTFSKIDSIAGITLSYKQGWSEEQSLEEVLAAGFSRDFELGYTQYGPQRTDLQVQINKVPVQDVLSRGQQKSVVYALRLAQGLLLRQSTGKHCVFLLDDLTSELDNTRISRMIELLKEIESQVYITGVRLDGLEGLVEDSQAQCSTWNIESMVM